MKEDNEDKDGEFNRILRINHPLVGRLKNLLNIKYNIYIEGKNDLDALLKSLGFKEAESDWVYIQYERVGRNNKIYRLSIPDSLFDEENLRYIKSTDWDDSEIKYEEYASINIVDEDDLPF